MINENNYDFFFWLSVMSNWCQLESYAMNKKQLSNDDLMRHLQKQDNILESQNKALEEQTKVYLEKIVEQNEEILSILKGGKNNAR